MSEDLNNQKNDKERWKMETNEMDKLSKQLASFEQQKALKFKSQFRIAFYNGVSSYRITVTTNFHGQ